jgi:hypothetical protein
LPLDLLDQREVGNLRDFYVLFDIARLIFAESFYCRKLVT